MISSLNSSEDIAQQVLFFIHLTATLTSCSIGTNRVGLVELVGFFTCSIGNQPFSVGLVD